LFVIQPDDVDAFLQPQSVGRIPGVDKVTEARLLNAGVRTVGDLRGVRLEKLDEMFGRHGRRHYELARGTDDNPVVPNRPTKSVSAEDTFQQDAPLSETEALIRSLAEKAWTASRTETCVARTVVLKLKTREFRILTRSLTPAQPPSSFGELTSIALNLARVDAEPNQLFRLVGVGLSNFQEPQKASAQPDLFD
jgi:DNA polymerase IV